MRRRTVLACVAMVAITLVFALAFLANGSSQNDAEARCEQLTQELGADSVEEDCVDEVMAGEELD